MPLLSLFVLTLTSLLTTAEGHAYVYWPHSRQYVKDPATMHSQNVEKNGIKGMTSKWGGGPPGRGGPRSSERMFWDICGNPAYSAIQGTTDSMDGFGGPPVATYEQGGEIEFIVVVNGEHGGIHQFRLCDKKVGSGLGGVKENAECLDKYFIGEGCTPGSGCGCKDDKCKDQTPHKDAWKWVRLQRRQVQRSNTSQGRKRSNFLTWPSTSQHLWSSCFQIQSTRRCELRTLHRSVVLGDSFRRVVQELYRHQH